MVRSLRLFAVVVGIALLAGACARRGGVRAGAREQRLLVQQAERDLACPRSDLVLTVLTERVVQVHGCGQLRDYHWVLSARRGRWVPIQAVVQRAAAELGCSSHELQVEAPGPTVRTATGCGRTARYDLVCGSMQCAWMMTSQGAGWGESAVTAGSVGAPGSAAGSTPAPAAGAQVVVAPAAGPGAGDPSLVPVAVPPPPEDDVAIPEPPAPGSAEALLRVHLDHQRVAIHRCAGVGVIPVRVSWTEDGVASLALDPPLAGSPAEACIRAAVPLPTVPRGAAGELVHSVP